MNRLFEKLMYSLTSPRLWAMLILVAAGYIRKNGFTLDPVALATSLELFAGGYLGIGTIDRAVDKFSLVEDIYGTEEKTPIK